MESLKEYNDSTITNVIRILEDSIIETENLESRGLDGDITGVSYARMHGHLLATIKIALIHLREIQGDSQE